MAFTERYNRLQEQDRSCRGEEDDLEDNESDTTKFSSTVEIFDKTHLLPVRENLDTSISALAQRKAAKRTKELGHFWTWLRWGVIVGLQTVLILLLSVNNNEKKDSVNSLPDLSAGDRTVETGGDINGLYKTCKYLTVSLTLPNPLNC